MLFLAPTWQEMIATLPPDEQAELILVLSGHGDDEDSTDDED